MFKDKAALVKNIFSSISKDYDLMNNVMSFGIHHLWKEEFIKIFSDYSKSLLDVAAGTADISTRYFKKAQNQGFKPEIVLCDINENMLIEGRNKSIDNNILSDFNFVVSDAEKLAFKDNSFDNYSIAFGIRNVTNIELALKEAYRVLKPGGKFACLEFSKPTNSTFAKIYNFYSKNIIPLMGKFIASNEDAYIYLVESIKFFLKQEDFVNLIKDAGFDKVGYKNLSLGIVAIHYGYKMK